MPYEDYLATHVFEPLGMSHTTFDLAREAELGFATNYAKSQGIVECRAIVAFARRQPWRGRADHCARCRALLRRVAERRRVRRHAGHLGRLDRADVDGRTGVGCRSNTDSAGARCQLPGLRLLSHAGDVGAPGAYGSSGSQFMLAPERQPGVGVLANLSSFEKAEIAQDTLTIAAWRRAGRATRSARLAAPDVRCPIAPCGRTTSATISRLSRFASIAKATSCSARDQDSASSSSPLSDTTFVMLSTIGALDEQPAEFQRQADGSVVILFHGQTLGVKR